MAVFFRVPINIQIVEKASIRGRRSFHCEISRTVPASRNQGDEQIFTVKTVKRTRSIQATAPDRVEHHRQQK